MPTSQVCQKRQRSAKPSVKPGAKALSARAVAREVVAGLEQLAPMSPKAVVSALRFALPEGGSAKIIHIARLIADLEPGKTPSMHLLSVKRTATADPLTTRTIEARSALSRSGQVLPSKEICETLSFTRQALSKAVKEHRMFAVAVGSNRRYPAFYTDTRLDRQQLESVAKELGSLPGWSKWQFFTTPKASLGGVTPLDALRNGRFTEARRAAIGFAER